jgi:hypothetical protein
LVHFCRYERAIAYSISPIDLHDFQGVSIMKIRLREGNQGPKYVTMHRFPWFQVAKNKGAHVFALPGEITSTG